MGKRKRPADATPVQYEQAPSRGRIVQTVQDKAGNLYIQNDSADHHQQSGQQQTTTTYYQIQTKIQQQQESAAGSVIQEHRTGGNQTQQQQIVESTQTTTEQDNVTFKCIKCEQIFPSKSVFMEHCNEFHYFACDLCSNCIFDDLYQLNVHMIKHINKYDMCEKCNMLCNSTEELKGHLGGHITTLNKNEVVFANSNGQTTTTNPAYDDSLIERLASELDQSIGNTVKIKPQKYRCGVCKQDFNDPRTLFKHMNQVHINLQAQVIQQQQQQQQILSPSPPPQPTTAVQIAQTQQQPSQATIQENVVYTNIDSNNIYYDERTGQYYTIALMDNSSPLSDTGGSSQSVIEYVQDAANMQQVQQHIEYIEDGGGHQSQETIIIEDESQPHHPTQQQQQQHTHNKITHSTIQQTSSSHHVNTKQQQQQVSLMNQNNNATTTMASSGGATISTDPPPLVQITRDTDLEELIPTTTLVAETPTQKVAKHEGNTVAGKQSGLTKCENCHNTFVKKLPKQMFCHNCVTRNTTAANKY